MNSTVRSITNAFRSLFGYPSITYHIKIPAVWTVADWNVLSPLYGLNVENEMVDTLAQEIRSSIDSDVWHNIHMLTGVKQRMDLKYNRVSAFDMNHRHKPSRFNVLNMIRKGGFKPRPTRYLTY